MNQIKFDKSSDSLSYGNDNHRLLIVGNPNPIHVGAHLLRAAETLEAPTKLCDTMTAFDAPWPIAKLNWWLWDHRPPRLQEFGAHVVQVCRRFRPSHVVATGIAPLDAATLEQLGRLRILRLNYLTDDPWNPAHKATWFLKALPLYDHVFTPRRSNVDDLRQAGCRTVSYLPFAYAPTLHFPDPPSPAEQRAFASDVIFAGGADEDRVPYIAALIRAGVDVALYGGYWDRFSETRGHTCGHADMPTLRKAIGGAKVALCLVRRANRDGHAMRTFEVPAIGACMLAEDTHEHREIFGPDDKAVVYFRTVDEMLDKLRWLLDHEEERRRLAVAAHKLIVEGRNTYKDRLMAMLEPGSLSS